MNMICFLLLLLIFCQYLFHIFILLYTLKMYQQKGDIENILLLLLFLLFLLPLGVLVL